MSLRRGHEVTEEVGAGTGARAPDANRWVERRKKVSMGTKLAKGRGQGEWRNRERGNPIDCEMDGIRWTQVPDRCVQIAIEEGTWNNQLVVELFVDNYSAGAVARGDCGHRSRMDSRDALNSATYEWSMGADGRVHEVGEEGRGSLTQQTAADRRYASRGCDVDTEMGDGRRTSRRWQQMGKSGGDHLVWRIRRDSVSNRSKGI